MWGLMKYLMHDGLSAWSKELNSEEQDMIQIVVFINHKTYIIIVVVVVPMQPQCSANLWFLNGQIR